MNEIIRPKSLIAYEEAARLAVSGDVADRRKVAGEAGVQPELLSMLAADPAAEVRQEIARNVASPAMADAILAQDADEDVRSEIAGKLTRSEDVVRDLAPEHVSVLETLARDQVTRIRKHLAEALADVADAPQALIDSVIRHLALDEEIEVAGVILERSQLLKDADLIEIISATPIPEAVSAVARRAAVPEAVSDAIVERTITPDGTWGGGAAVADLLSNPSAQIREQALDAILDAAPGQENWHAPLVRRPRLPARAMQRVAEVVTDQLLVEFQQREDFDATTIAAVADTVRRRMGESVPAHSPGNSAALDSEWSHLLADGADEDDLSDALLAGEKDVVRTLITRASNLPAPVVDSIIDSRSSRAVTALAWKCGYSMRFAMQLQMRLAGIAPRAMLNARNGTDYPMTEADMVWQLEFFGG